MSYDACPARGPVAPNPESAATTRRGLRRRSASGPSPWASIHPDRKFSTTASARSASRRKISRPSGVPTSSVIDRFPRLVFSNASEVWPSFDGP
jgi:hypothetical protein